MLARDRLTLNEMSWILIKVFFGSSYLGFVSATTQMVAGNRADVQFSRMSLSGFVPLRSAVG